MKHTDDPDPRLISFLTLRKALGGLGILLPVILPLGVWLTRSGEFQPSISKYYYTNMADVYVGILWAFGLFLFTYKGYKRSTFILSDNAVTNIAGLCAIATALFPTNPVGGSTNPQWIATVHFISAGSFFAILGATSVFIFTQTQNRARNNIFRICGIIIWLCLIVLLMYFLWLKSIWPPGIVFWLEAVMLWAFGTSWLIKGHFFNAIEKK